MDTFWNIVFFSTIGSVFSLAGGFALLLWKRETMRTSHFLSSFAAGALLATAFFELLPEAFHEAPDRNIFGWALAGMLFYFVAERFLHWFHHHHEHDKGEEVLGQKPVVSLIIFGDTFHNIIDGVAIASAFLVDYRLGIVTALATAAHEIPQEVGDFAILLKKGLSKKRVIMINLFSAFATVVAAVGTYFIGSQIKPYLPVMLALTAGFFIYIAASDLIPEIHHEKRKDFAIGETLLLMLGVATIWTAVTFLHPPHTEEHEEHHEETTQLMEHAE
jgi:zinc and cadmium transporter